MYQVGSAGRRLQDWTNKNVFVSSFDEIPSYQHDNNTAETQIDTQPEGGELREIKPNSDPHAPDGKPITALQAAWNVTNAIQGMFIVGLPFAVKVGGWWSVAALIGVSYICYLTGLWLIDCLYENGKKVRHSYKDVAEAVRPGMGKLVLFAQLTELASTCILYLVLAGDLLQGAFPGIGI
jgi:vesicular inhibitory amino acid transporter